jgi:tetratricopeptide (TPR) repeat protein
MKKTLFIITFLFTTLFSFAQTQAAPADPILYGSLQKNVLETAPYNKWFSTNYTNYEPAPEVIEAIRKMDMKNTSIEIYFGTWCGDSRREVPRFLKILDEISFPAKNVKIIGLGSADSLLKQSPQHEEKGRGIFRVPVFIIYRNGVETSRINEFPVNSLEKDLKQILGNQFYQPNYRSFSLVQQWLADGNLLDKNTSAGGLATQVRSLVSSERELNSLGYLLLNQGMLQEALKIFQINANLYPESAMVISSLGEGYYKAGDKENAIRYLERSLELNKDPAMIKAILKIIYQVRG